MPLEILATRICNSCGEFEADEEYAVLCLKGMKERNSEFYVGAFLIAQGGEGEDLLEN